MAWQYTKFFGYTIFCGMEQEKNREIVIRLFQKAANAGASDAIAQMKRRAS